MSLPVSGGEPGLGGGTRSVEAIPWRPALPSWTGSRLLRVYDVSHHHDPQGSGTPKSSGKLRVGLERSVIGSRVMVRVRATDGRPAPSLPPTDHRRGGTRSLPPREGMRSCSTSWIWRSCWSFFCLLPCCSGHWGTVKPHYDQVFGLRPDPVRLSRRPARHVVSLLRSEMGPRGRRTI